MFRQVNTRQSFPDMENSVNEFWKKNDIFKKSIINRSAKDSYVFYDGPPFITGTPHYGTLLSRIAKDVVPRYWTMKGKRVERQWGWDCHGLPIETKVEKKLDIKNRREIESYGVGRFIDECYKYTREVSSEWKWYKEKVGQWVDFDNSYKTMDQSYMESVMWVFKQLMDKGHIYEGTRVSLYCNRCGTPVSNFEIAMDNSYSEMEDPAVTVKFPITTEGEFKGISVLAWTTTPWTLPSNRALVVDPDETYVVAEVQVETGVDKVILAKKRVATVLKDKANTIIKEFKGIDLIGLKYEPPFSFFSGSDKEWQIYSFPGMVTMEEGTGVVHSAVGFGEIDSEMGKEYGLTIAMSIDDQGKFVDKVAPYKGIYIKDADPLIVEDLKKAQLLFHSEKIMHRYPFCYRCATPLIYKTQPSWFINVQALKPQLLENNEWINWVPDHLKDGRFKKGIEMAPDWGISRTRYWATPMPVWQKMEDGKVVERKVAGSRDEIRELSVDPITKISFLVKGSDFNTNADEKVELFLADKKELAEISKQVLEKEKVDSISYADEGLLEDAFHEYVLGIQTKFAQFLMSNIGKNLEVVTDPETLAIIRHTSERYILKEVFAMDYPINQPFVMFFNKAELMDLHRPKIDNIKLKGKTGELTRVAEVLDVWMDSASMPYACKHYPFEHKEEFEAAFPADFVVEYIAQTRAWFYVMHVISTALFNKNSFKNIVTTGVLSGNDGRKMSKSYGNYPDPKATILKYGAEPLRLFLMGSRIMVGEDINFDEEGLKEQVKTIILPLWNSYSFLTTYANMKGWNPREELARNGRRDPANKTQWDHIPFETVDNKLDQWIIAKLQLTIRDFRAGMDEYNIPSAVKVIPAFIDDLSKWFIRRSRNRFASGEQSAFDTMYYVLVEFTKLMAPFTPFISEELYQNLVNEALPNQIESVHLCDLPEYDAKFLEAAGDMLGQMDTVKDIVTLGQSLRVDNGLKVRQPLAEIQVKAIEITDWMKALIMDELNIKQVTSVAEIIDDKGWINGENTEKGLKITINTNLTDEMKQEGTVRELIRAIQNMRKKAGLQMGDKVAFEISTDDNFTYTAIENNVDMLRDGINASQLSFQKGKDKDAAVLNINKLEVYVKLIK